MKLSIISDTHFGDPACGLVKKNAEGAGYKIGPKYNEFKKNVGTKNNYLILLGDIFDFSITSYAEAYAASQIFFSQIVADNITDEIIYVPGNHDFEFWHWVENEVNVINQIVTKNINRGNTKEKDRLIHVNTISPIHPKGCARTSINNIEEQEKNRNRQTYDTPSNRKYGTKANETKKRKKQSQQHHTKNSETTATTFTANTSVAHSSLTQQQEQ